MRVLIAAFACRPGAGSEPGAGWEFAKGAALAGHEVTLLTQNRNKASIEAALLASPTLPIHTVYLGLSTAVMERWDRSFRLRGLQIYYIAWQRQLRKIAQNLNAEKPFDIAHHVTMSCDWAKSGLSDLRGVPLIWGPLGGSERIPRELWPWLRWRGLLRELLRRTFLSLLQHFGGAKKAWSRAMLLVAQNNDEAAALRRKVATKVIVHPNVFLDSAPPSDTQDVAQSDTGPVLLAGDEPPIALFAARLLAWKGGGLVLDAMRDPLVSAWQLEIYGAGPDEKQLRKQARRLQLTERVKFVGHVQRDELRRRFISATAFVYPSFREPAGWVVAEALQAGCPVVTLSIGGPQHLLKDTGRIVEVSDQAPHNIAKALVSVATDERCKVNWGTTELPALLTRWYDDARR